MSTKSLGLMTCLSQIFHHEKRDLVNALFYNFFPFQATALIRTPIAELVGQDTRAIMRPSELRYRQLVPQCVAYVVSKIFGRFYPL